MLHCGGTSKFQQYVGSCQIMTIIIMIVIIIIIIIIIIMIIIFSIKNNLLVITKLTVKTYLQSISLKKKKKKIFSQSLTRPQSSSRNARGGSRGWWEGKRKEDSLPRFPPSHHTPRATKERQRERRMGTSQSQSTIYKSFNFINSCSFRLKKKRKKSFQFKKKTSFQLKTLIMIIRGSLAMV